MGRYSKQSVSLQEKKHVKSFGFALEKGNEKEMLVSKNSLYCDCRGGKLKCGVGLSPYLQNNAAIAYKNDTAREIFLLKKLKSDGYGYTENILVIDDGGSTYYYESSTKNFKLCTLSGENSHICSAIGQDKKIVNAIGAKSKLVLLDEGYSLTSNLLKGTGAVCFYRHRLFCGVQPNLLYYSAPNDWSNFEESIDDGGWINFGQDFGGIVALCTLKDSLYVFFEGAIFRLEEMGSARYFAPERIAYSGGRIYGRTVGVCGNTIFFLTKDGVYRFADNKVEFVETGIKINEEYATKKFSCASHNGKMCIRYFDETNTGRTIVIYEDGKSWYFTGEMRGLGQADGRAMALNNKMIAFLDDDGPLPIDNEFYFNDCETDFGTEKRKRVTKIRFEGKGVFDFTLRNGFRTVTKRLTFEDGKATLDLQERGTRFTLDFTLQQGARIDSMTVEYYTLK